MGQALKITVIGRDNTMSGHGWESVLIYDLNVPSLDHDVVRQAFVEQRETDIDGLTDEEKEEIEILFAFEGDLKTIADWRS